MQVKKEAPSTSLRNLNRPREATYPRQVSLEQPKTGTTRKYFFAFAAALLLVITLLTFAAGDETSGDETYQKAMIALINRQFPEAIVSFEKILTSNPGMSDKIALPYAEALIGLADNLHKTNPQQAIALFKKALQLDPRSVRAHFQLGLVLTAQKNYAAAIESYQKAIILNPDFPDTFFNLGFIYAVSKNFAKAEEMYGRTVELKPDYLDEALFNLALVQSKQNKKEQSLANLNRALTVNPKNQSVRNYLKKLQGGSAE